MIRTMALALPATAFAGRVWPARHDRRATGAALLAFLSAFVGVAALNTVATRLGLWTFATVHGSHLGLPVDLWIGWALVWGPLPMLLPRMISLPAVLLGLFWLDVVLMPPLTPLLSLGRYWLAGDAVGILFVATPSILLGRWTMDQRRLAGRATLQVAVFAALVSWLVPTTAISHGDGSWRYLAELPAWQFSLVLQLAAVAAVPGVLAVREFVQRGAGTPFPWDPPRVLVTTGPYAFVANPMQMSVVSLSAVLALATRSWTVAATAAVMTCFSLAVAAPHEHDDLSRRHGAAWASYRRAVRSWWPRWRPVAGTPARLYLAVSCEVCASTAVALNRLDPVGLVIVDAESQWPGLRRARYVGPDGYQADGVAAVARGLEHASLGWAVVGGFLRLPLLAQLAQVMVDGLIPRAGIRSG